MNFKFRRFGRKQQEPAGAVQSGQAPAPTSAQISIERRKAIAAAEMEKVESVCAIVTGFPESKIAEEYGTMDAFLGKICRSLRQPTVEGALSILENVIREGFHASAAKQSEPELELYFRQISITVLVLRREINSRKLAGITTPAARESAPAARESAPAYRVQ